jgi:tyrosyl-tRNA synthetase
VPQFEITRDQLGQPAIELLTTVAPVFPSKGEMRKMVQGGGVSLNKEKLTDQQRPITADDLIDGKYLLAQKGKKNYYLLIVR